MEILDRFLQYVSFDTQSDPKSESYPSTQKQLTLLAHLKEELTALGLSDVSMDEKGYVMATLPASPGYENRPVIGFISHVDTAPDMPGVNVKPRIIESYDGGDIALNDSVVMKVSEFPELSFYKGHRLVVTDGTTLLGADDKAGIAEIVTAMEYFLAHPEEKHGPIRVGFTPDEEVGHGVDFFDVGKFGAKFAYTVDGGMEGELEYENFNAAGANIVIQGMNIHPGYAKNKMLNSLHLACELNSLLPPWDRPEHTEGYEGFFHLTGINGNVERAEMEYIIRDHDKTRFEERKAVMQGVVDWLNNTYGKGVFTLTMNDQYYNMREKVEPFPEVINKAVKAMEQAGVKPEIKPIRGGTDGARLSFMGLPCPNLFTGAMNFHGKFEYCSVQTMTKAMQTVVNLAKLWAEE
ncbi:peptidase T [Desulfovibrio sp. OttesenSCG-928-G15]|nr:peptidase T [Desulfovibrio sp. OttesenSCG-928-G15]